MKRVSDFLEILCDRTGSTYFAHAFYLKEWLTNYGYSALNKSKNLNNNKPVTSMKITVWQLWIKLLYKSLDRFFCESKFLFLLGMSENTRSHSKCMLNCVSNYQIFSKVARLLRILISKIQELQLFHIFVKSQYLVAFINDSNRSVTVSHFDLSLPFPNN